jgi:hypothetical protein
MVTAIQKRRRKVAAENARRAGIFRKLKYACEAVSTVGFLFNSLNHFSVPEKQKHIGHY